MTKIKVDKDTLSFLGLLINGPRRPDRMAQIKQGFDDLKDTVEPVVDVKKTGFWTRLFNKK